MPTSAALAERPRGLVVSTRRLQDGALWLLVFSGAFVLFEPAPHEAFFALTGLVFAVTGLRAHRAFGPMIVALMLFNVGGLLALAPYVDVSVSVTFTAISIYMTFITILIACVMLDRPIERLDIVRRAWVAGAVLTSMAGIIGYFSDGIAHDLFTRYDRAMGAFKDPNVLGPFLILPIVLEAQRLLVGDARGFWPQARAVLALLVMFGALFLTFSRGAWGVAAGALMLTAGLTFATCGDGALRLRIAVISIGGLAALVVLLLIALSIPAIYEIFVLRASLKQDYDLGELGRFGAQMRSIPLLLESPLGFGPLRFHIVMGNEDPHNVYVNAFASYGWIGGLGYVAFVVMTLAMGWRMALRRGPLRMAFIPVWSVLFLHIVQGLQIDTDHWRHLYLLFGLAWGLAAADEALRRAPRSAPGGGAHRRASA